MGKYVANQVVKLMIKRGIPVANSNILIMGLTFKENCPDLRNTRVVDIIDELNSYNAKVDIHDPWVDQLEAKNEYGIEVINNLDDEKYDAIILAVAHKQFAEMGIEQIRKIAKNEHVIYDIKHLLPANSVDGRL